jgi:hypothetical protein
MMKTVSDQSSFVFGSLCVRIMVQSQATLTNISYYFTQVLQTNAGRVAQSL